MQKNPGPVALLVLGLALGSLLCGCSKPDSRRILGHWRAERLQLQGVSLPMGPEFVVSSSDLRSTDGSIQIPLTAINAKDDTTTLVLGTPLEIGLSFKFETDDRISFALPMVNTKVYYQRVPDSPLSGAPAAVSQQTQTLSITPPDAGASPKNVVHSPERQASAHESSPSDDASRQQKTLGPSVKPIEKPDPMLDYNLSILHMRQGDADTAVRNLRDAFEHGFRDFGSLDRNPDLTQLKNDPRYIALLTRYR